MGSLFDASRLTSSTPSPPSPHGKLERFGERFGSGWGGLFKNLLDPPREPRFPPHREKGRRRSSSHRRRTTAGGRRPRAGGPTLLAETQGFERRRGADRGGGSPAGSRAPASPPAVSTTGHPLAGEPRRARAAVGDRRGGARLGPPARSGSRGRRETKASTHRRARDAEGNVGGRRRRRRRTVRPAAPAPGRGREGRGWGARGGPEARSGAKGEGG